MPIPKASISRLVLAWCGILGFVAGRPAAAVEEEIGPPGTEGGVYLEASGGSTRSLDQDLSLEKAVGSVGGDIDFKTGFQAGGAIGYRIRAIRFELAAQFRRQAVESFTFVGLSGPASGDLDVTTGLLNAYYDFDLGWPVYPFIGAGIGLAHLDMDAEVRPRIFIADDDTNEIAWNAMLGSSMAIAPSTELFLRYRHVELFDEATIDASFQGLADDLDFDFSTNEFGMGLRYTF